MSQFLNFVIKIAFTHLYKDSMSTEAHQLYEGFFPKERKDKKVEILGN